LRAAQLRIPLELEPRPLGGIAARKAGDLGRSLIERTARGLELFLRLLQHFEGHDLGMLQGPAVITVGLEDRGLPLDLVLRFPRDGKIDLPNVLESIGDIAAHDLHPDVGAALENVDLAVADLLDEPLGILADRVEPVGDLLVAVADLHLCRFAPDDLVEHFRLPEGASDDRDLIPVEIGDLREQGVDRSRLDNIGHQPDAAQGAGRLVQILHRRFCQLL
jgi:hypothetical protein